MDLEAQILEDNLANLRNQGEVGGFLRKGRRRKSKNDKEERNFICGCGKDYFSYPALYTHIKNKHNGIAPEGTELEAQNKTPPLISKRSEGRGASSKPDSDIDEDDLDADTEREDEKNVEKAVKVFRTEEIKLVDFELLDFLDARGSCNYDWSFNKIVDKNTDILVDHPLLTAVRRLVYNPAIELRTVNLVLAKFLLELSKISRKEFYGMCAFILRTLQECLDLYGYSLLTRLEQGSEKVSLSFKGKINQDTFTDIENTDYIAMAFDFYVKCFLPSYLNDQDFEFDFVIKFLRLFNGWLIAFNLSKVEVRFNSV